MTASRRAHHEKAGNGNTRIRHAGRSPGRMPGRRISASARARVQRIGASWPGLARFGPAISIPSGNLSAYRIFLGLSWRFWDSLDRFGLVWPTYLCFSSKSGRTRVYLGRSGHSWPVLGCSGPRIFGPARNPAAHRVFLGLFGPPASSAARFGPFPLRGSRKRAKKARGLNTNRCDFPVSCIY